MKRLAIHIVLTFMIMTHLSGQTEYTLCLFDSVRQRPVAVAVYAPPTIGEHTPVLIFNHGYGVNAGGSYLAYSSLNKPLSAKGYFVISIQHELVGDPLLAMEGNFRQTRMPSWERGVENILFVYREFRKLKPELDWGRLTVMGHSNGGDMTMLLATRYPELMHKAISLDHRRMLMPRTSQPRIYTLRGCDYPADPQVIPTADEQQTHRMTVVKLDRVKHADMDDKGSVRQHEEMLDHLFRFLEE